MVAALSFGCANCQEDFDEPYCDLCGKNLSSPRNNDRPAPLHLRGKRGTGQTRSNPR